MNDMSLKTQFEDSHYDPQHEAIKRMYCAKVLGHLEDLIGPSNEDRERWIKRKAFQSDPAKDYRDALRFFRKRPDANFGFFVLCAGFDPDEFHRRALSLHDAPEADRKAAAKRMIAKMEAAE